MSKPEWQEATIDALAKLHAKEALAVQVEIMRDDTLKPEARLKAATEVLNRAAGTPARALVYVPAKQKVAQQLAQMSDDQLLAMAHAARDHAAQAEQREADERQTAEREAASPDSPFRSAKSGRLLPFRLDEDEVTDAQFDPTQ